MEMHCIAMKVLHLAVREIKRLKGKGHSAVEHLQRRQNLLMSGHLPYNLQFLMQPGILKAHRLQPSGRELLEIHVRFQLQTHLIEQGQPARVINLEQPIALKMKLSR